MPTRISCSGEQLCLLARLNLTVRSSENFREKVEPLSLKFLPFPLFSPTPTVGSSWSSGRVLLLPHVSLLLAHLITSHPLSIIVDFHPLRKCHMSTWAPLGSPGLTNSAHDKWYLLSHSNCAKCPALPMLPRKT